MRTSTLPFLSAMAACLLAPASVALAAAPGASSVSLSPLCVTKSGAVLFFMEQVDDCEGAGRQCRRNHWAYAALKAPAAGWEFEALGDASLDEEATPEKNADSARQTFRAPASHQCVSFFRAPKLASPDLPYAEAWFQYSIEKGVLVLHWQGQRASVQPDVKLWKLGWCLTGCGSEGPGPRAEPLALKPELTLQETKTAQDGKQSTGPASVVPAVELSLGTDIVLGFPQPSVAGTKERGFFVVRVPQEQLHKLQASLLHDDARRLLEKAAGDLFATSKAAGLLDAALQLAPDNGVARLDYARLLAMQGEAAPVVRELEKIRTMPGLRATLEKDQALAVLRGNEAFKKFVESLQ